VVCNTGTRLVPTIDGRTHRFNNVGLYDALFVMQDAETKTLWNHITGEALFGPLVGRRLGPPGNVLPMTVEQALTVDADTRIAISDRAYFAGGRQFGAPGRSGGRAAGAGRGGGVAVRAGAGPARGSRGPDPNATLSEMFVKTLGREDARRPRMDMGLGVWTGATARYYPMDVIRQRGEALVDVLEGRRVLVYVDPDTYAPAALFVPSTRARLEGKEVHLDGGHVVRSGMLFGPGGSRLATERPQQVFTRWYGFALTFPGTEVFGQPAEGARR
jgi:hypothetical protein